MARSGQRRPWVAGDAHRDRSTIAGRAPHARARRRHRVDRPLVHGCGSPPDVVPQNVRRAACAPGAGTPPKRRHAHARSGGSGVAARTPDGRIGRPRWLVYKGSAGAAGAAESAGPDQPSPGSADCRRGVRRWPRCSLDHGSTGPWALAARDLGAPPAQVARTAQVPPLRTSPRTASRARLTAAARRAKSAPTRTLPRTRARRPPWRRRMR